MGSYWFSSLHGDKENILARVGQIDAPIRAPSIACRLLKRNKLLLVHKSRILENDVRVNQSKTLPGNGNNSSEMILHVSLIGILINRDLEEGIRNRDLHSQPCVQLYPLCAQLYPFLAIFKDHKNLNNPILKSLTARKKPAHCFE